MWRIPGTRLRRAVLAALLAVVAPPFSGCGDHDGGTPTAEVPSLDVHPLLARFAEVAVAPADASSGVLGDEAKREVDRLIQGPEQPGGLGAITVDYPLDGSVFPPDFVAPTFLWHDAVPEADTWLIRIRFPGEPDSGLDLLVPGTPPSEGETDPRALGVTNENYQFTPYQASARTWSLSEAVWAAVRKLRGAGAITIHVVGFSSSDPATPLSSGRVHLSVSDDPVGAPIFYRDVPLMPDVGESGVIKPLNPDALPNIAWRLKDVSRRDSRVVLTGMRTCANCHSFSGDGRTLAMDVDGPQGDKGVYTIAPIQPKTTIDREHVITWNSFPGKEPGHKTIGFLSRVSPAGEFVVSTVNESVYVVNFPNWRFLQVFYPTRGILAYYSVRTDTMKALPGADDPEYVHCNAVWTPDGKTLVFCRAKAKDPFPPGRPLATYPNDPNETQIQYDLYRIPFENGRGGTPVPIEGASANGMSNTFPKVSPDGRWIVFTKCKNGLLMRPDGRLWIVPLEGGTPRKMRCNTEVMNSWHSFSPNGRWLVFSSKVNRPYTEMFLTHIDEDGNDTPPILIPDATAANRAVNIPEFLNASYDALTEIDVPAVNHYVYFQRGYALRAEMKLEEARVQFEKAVAAQPDFTIAHGALAGVFEQLGKADQARTHYGEVLALDPRDVYALNRLGTLLLAAGELEPATALFRRVLEIDANDVLAHNSLGMALGRLGVLDKAKEHFLRAVQIDPSFLAGHKNLGVLALEAGQTSEAIAHFEAALDAGPTDGPARGYLAQLLLEAGRTAEALRHLDTLIEQQPGDARARTMAAWHLATSADARTRDGARAVKLGRRAVELTQGRDPMALDALGAALAESGAYAEAAQAAEAAARLADTQDREFAAEIRTRRQLYEAGRPFRVGR